MGYVTEKFSKRLKELRETAGLTQEQLAKELKVSRGAISYYEKGERTPDIEFLDSLAMYFDLPIDFALGYTDNIKEAHKNMYEFYGLTDAACDELDHHNETGNLISCVLGHKDYFALRELYKGMLENYKTFDYSKLNYISFLIADILNHIIHDSLATLLDMQYTPEEKEALNIKTKETIKKLDELKKLLEEQKATLQLEFEKDIEKTRQELKDTRHLAIEKIREKFTDTVDPAEFRRNHS